METLVLYMTVAHSSRGSLSQNGKSARSGKTAILTTLVRCIVSPPSPVTRETSRLVPAKRGFIRTREIRADCKEVRTSLGCPLSLVYVSKQDIFLVSKTGISLIVFDILIRNRIIPILSLVDDSIVEAQDHDDGQANTQEDDQNELRRIVPRRILSTKRLRPDDIGGRKGDVQARRGVRAFGMAGRVAR
ncbi:hypothetical protein M8818_003535 [Zalaria obscura]|uniref:Uncharacterized protein n=1 Tax=Zalaria obscura TaxID=2024903 RepID=A0ACC3SEH8_9PEZI